MAQQVIENLKVYLKKVSDRRFVEKCGSLENVRMLEADEQVRWFKLVDKETQFEALSKFALRRTTLLELLPIPEYTVPVSKWLVPVNIKGARTSKQILWFENTRSDYRELALTQNDLGTETLNKLFENEKYADMVISYMNLTDGQFANLLTRAGCSKSLRNYLSKKTLSVPKLVSLIDATVRHAGAEADGSDAWSWSKMLRDYIVREGLPTPLIQFVADYPEKKMGTLKQLINEASEIHAHIYVVKNGMLNGAPSPTFVQHLSYLSRENLTMPDEAAVLMNGLQVIAFHKAGLHLSQRAIATLLANDSFTDNDFASPMYCSILENEVMYPMWPELKLVLEAKPDVYHHYERAVNAQTIKKANS